MGVVETVEFKIEFQNVHARFPEKSQVTSFGVPLHQCAKIFLLHVS